ncbi:unnamed protein product [Caenorhabditis auriculariae]|uniref:Phytanoyl-CoA hydroxylase-interacting protein-like C-terminal domain-containing protein n=1 Tax=Caenorhabditis auriculariae TaxID=2777116 RepID=A0A8S1GP11_9PELO|nr:unnamed protein product [Caenorhabditis auriculariae]
MNWGGDSWREYANWNHENTMRSWNHGASWGPPALQYTPYYRPSHYQNDRRNGIYSNPSRSFHPYAKATQQQRLPAPQNNLHQFQNAGKKFPGLRSGRILRDQVRERELLRAQNNEEKKMFEKIDLQFDISSQRIELRWKAPTSIKNVFYRLKCSDPKNPSNKWVTCERTWTQTYYELKTTPGQLYCIDVECLTLTDSKLIARGYEEVRAAFNYEELKRLYEKCIKSVTTNKNDFYKHEFYVLYRCKPKLYWDEIHHCCNGIMHKYIKDDNGQPGNLINGLINGLFFSARLLPDGSMPVASPFGNVRMSVNAVLLLDPNKYHFYFSDFYCNYMTHYVTVVICLKGSDTDKYCYSKLLRLNPEDNPFLQVVASSHPYYPPRFFVNSSVWVEIYYTEDIPLNWGSFDAIDTKGAGTSKIGGLPNNKACTKCNLYPVEMKTSENLSAGSATSIDVTVQEESVNSTLHVLTLADRSGLHEVFEDVVITICDLVDSVCENVVLREEVLRKSDEDVEAALERMNRDVSLYASTPPIVNAAKILSDFVKSFTKQRNAALNALRELQTNARND